MPETQPLFPASTVGSLPRPLFVQDLILGGADPFGNIVNRAVLYALTLQMQAGLDVITDGEWRRKSYIGVIAEVASGFTHYLNPAEGNRSWHTVTSKLEHRRPGFVAKEVAFLRQFCVRRVKVCLPSPYLLGERMYDPEISPKAYKHCEEFMEALVPILRQEAILARNAGADIIQIDDPHICLFVDEEVRAKFKDPDAELRRACSLVNEVVREIPGVEFALHLCRRNKGRSGWVGKGGYDPIIPYISDIAVNQLVLEYTVPVAGDFSALAALPEKFSVGLGCVDCRFDHIDTPEEIVRRVEQALVYINPERVWLNPDCGFAPGSQANIPLDEAYLKLKNEVQAARILREKYSRNTVDLDRKA